MVLTMKNQKLEKTEKQPGKDRPDNTLLSFREAQSYLGFSHSYLYRLTSQKLIPHYKPTGKVIFFSKEELQAWVFANRISKKQTTITKQ
jgi:excisionase family DNA binding protein